MFAVFLREPHFAIRFAFLISHFAVRSSQLAFICSDLERNRGFQIAVNKLALFWCRYISNCLELSIHCEILLVGIVKMGIAVLEI